MQDRRFRSCSFICDVCWISVGAALMLLWIVGAKDRCKLLVINRVLRMLSQKLVNVLQNKIE